MSISFAKFTSTCHRGAAQMARATALALLLVPSAGRAADEKKADAPPKPPAAEAPAKGAAPAPKVDTKDKKAAYDAMFQRGGTEFAGKNYKESMEFFEKALEFKPNDPQAEYWVGVNHLYLGNYTAAEKMARKVLKEQPVFIRSRTLLALSLKKQNKPDEALKEFMEALRTEKNDIGLYQNIGSTYVDLKRYPEALEAFNLAMTKVPDEKVWDSVRADLHYSVALCYSHLGYHDEGLENLKIALEIQPKNAQFQTLEKEILKIKADMAAEEKEKSMEGEKKDTAPAPKP